MNIQELIERYKSYEGIWDALGAEAARKCFLRDLEQLEDLPSGHAEEAPRYVKNVLARLRELPLHDREVWLKAIMSEFERVFSCAIWREGYKQGKFEGAIERERVKVSQFVADWYEENKDDFEGNLFRCAHNIPSIFDGAKLNEFEKWFLNASTKPFQILVNMHQFGYEVEKEPKYKVKLKGILKNNNYLNYNSEIKNWYHASSLEIGMVRTKFTRKELEEAGFGWVFNCPGIEIEEVE